MEQSKRFLFLGENVLISDNVAITDISKTWIGNSVLLNTNSLLGISDQGNNIQKLRIKIGDRSYIGRNNTLESFNQIILEEDVMIAANVYLSDSQHEYRNAYIPPKFQKAESINNVLLIKRGVWIGHAATVIGNITLGCGSIIGANSVVTFDVPSHCIVKGNPAMIFKIYHYKLNKWIIPRTEEEYLQILNDRGDFDGYDDKVLLEYLKADKSFSVKKV